MIPEAEKQYIHARTQFERYDIRAKGIYNQDATPIAPDAYLRWLHTATHQYAVCNAKTDVTLRPIMRVQASILAGLGYLDAEPRHGEVALTVAPHWQRVEGAARGYAADGDRVHMHHSPSYESVAQDINYHEAISVGIGDALHQALHVARDPRRPYETRQQQVDGDFDFVAPRMEARGYAAREIAAAREKAHDMNNDLGLYRHGR